MPIPLPSEVGHGQSLTMNAFNVAELSKSPVYYCVHFVIHFLLKGVFSALVDALL